MENNAILELNMRAIFSSSQPDNYRIPIYQRNYSWKEGQIKQLINDIADYAQGHCDKKYYIGTLVVSKVTTDGETHYETIDGQQRLTTLSILLSVLKNHFNKKGVYAKPILDFEHRKVSSHALQLAFEGNFNSTSKYNVGIKNAYDIILNELNLLQEELLKKDDNSFEAFVTYLMEKVILIRVEVPKDTDLNHYFEIMNSRGEQLEKHEVIKSKLLGILSDKDNGDEEEIRLSKELFHLIWEGTSQMERYIQYAFPKDLRHLIFSDKWDTLNVSNYDDLFRKYKDYLLKLEKDKKEKGISELISFVEATEEIQPKSLNDIITDSIEIPKTSTNKETPDRFSTIINFPNFLLHCLSIQVNKIAIPKEQRVTLDDKNLIKHFEDIAKLEKAERIKFVKDFMFTLLKCKFLLDQYVIKRETTGGKEVWSLKRLYFYSDTSQSYINTFSSVDGDVEHNDTISKKIILLLTMFHTVTPNMSYKHWLNGTLRFLFLNYDQQKINSQEYAAFLKDFAKKIVFKILLAKNQSSYEDLIYGELDKIQLEEGEINFELASYGQIRHNLLFNYIDFLLLEEFNRGTFSHGDYSRNFEFTFRSSVEHYYPQNPKEGSKSVDEALLHSIGNLTLISHSKNSAMNNYLPKAKKEHYKNGTIADSLKQYVMFNKSENDTWTVQDIEKHEKEIISLLTKQIY